jgi:hypothetical protein
MEVISDYYLIRQIKLAVYRITYIGDQIKIWMVNEPGKVVFYKILGVAALSEIEKVKCTIEAEGKLLNLEVKQDRN